MKNLQKYNGLQFEFAEVFTCWVTEEGVWIEQYYEGSKLLPHIKTEKQFEQFYKLLTGKPIDELLTTTAR